VRNKNLDLLKFVAACFVVCIHSRLTGMLGQVIVAVAKFAVPVFFITSGYYAYGKKNEEIIKQIKKLFAIFYKTTIIYFIFDLFMRSYGVGWQGAVQYIKEVFNKGNIFWLIIANYTYTAGHLWFILALEYVYIIYYFMRKIKMDIKWYFVVILLVCFFALLETKQYLPIYRNYLFFGLPFFFVGGLIKKNYDRINLSNKLLWILVVVGVAESITDFYIAGVKEIYIGSIIMSISLFIIAIKNRNIPMEKHIEALLPTNLYIYLYHYILVLMFNNFLAPIGDIRAIVYIVISVLLADAIYLGKKRVKQIEIIERKK